MAWIGAGPAREPGEGRRTVLAGVALGAAAGALVLFGLLKALPPPADPDVGLAWIVLPPALTLLALSVCVGAGRFLTPGIDPTAGRDGRFVQVTNRALQNSVEQGVIFAFAGIALMTLGAPGSLAPLPAFGLSFGLARLAFWLGYLRDPLWRAPGMAFTYLLNFALLGYALLGA